jgi:hypothetical protein
LPLGSDANKPKYTFLDNFSPVYLAKIMQERFTVLIQPMWHICAGKKTFVSSFFTSITKHATINGNIFANNRNMKRIITRSLVSALIVTAFLVSTNSAHAQTATYNFDAPNFAVGNVTPFNNIAPNTNVGLPAFTTSFSSVGSFAIDTFQINGLFSGQMIYAPSGSDALDLVFNTPITSLSVDFGVNDFIPGGNLTLTSAGGSTVQTAIVQAGGDGFTGGTLSIVFGTPVTSVSLSGFDSGNAPTVFGIDNLVLSTGVAAPEPATLSLLTLGGVGMLTRRRRNQQGKQGKGE